MHVLCTICSDIVNQAESLYVTKCGHLFHHHCLSQWIERSKTCPQCRNTVSGLCMWRVYPTAAAAGGEDAAALQARLDDAQLAARTHAQQTRAEADARRDAGERLANAQEQLKASEKRLARAESAAAALREQLEFVRAQSKDVARLRTNCELLQGKLDTLQALQKVVEASAEEVEVMLEGYSDARTIAVFANAFKRAVGTAEKARRSAESRLAATRASLAVERARNNYLTQENNKLKELAATEPRRGSKRKSSDSETSLPHKQSRIEPSVTLPNTTTMEAGAAAAVAAANDVSLGTLVARIEAADSPYLALRHAPPALSLQPILEVKSVQPSTSSGRENKPWAANKPPAPPNKFSIFHKAPPHNPLEYFSSRAPDYDGLGGRSKPEHCPSPSAPPGPPAPPRVSFAPKLSAKHKLTRKPTAQDIGAMIQRINSKKNNN